MYAYHRYNVKIPVEAPKRDPYTIREEMAVAINRARSSA
jgi:hypothetical protein